MSIQLRDGTTTNLANIDTLGSQRVRPFHPVLNGSYRVGVSSGLITGIAAGTASAGHLFAFRWGHASKLAIISYFRARWLTVAGFTAAQEIGMDLFQTRVYSASHTVGSAITPGSSMRKRNTHGNSDVTDARISATVQLGNGTHTIDTSAIAQGGFSELAAGATVPKGFFDLRFAANDPAWSHPIVLGTNEGLILRNSVLMGAGGTARVSVEMEWHEVDAY